VTRADELKRVYGVSLAHPIGMTLTFWTPPGVRTGRVPVIRWVAGRLLSDGEVCRHLAFRQLVAAGLA
jgi:hypothetical protein